MSTPSCRRHVRNAPLCTPSVSDRQWFHSRRKTNATPRHAGTFEKIFIRAHNGRAVHRSTTIDLTFELCAMTCSGVEHLKFTLRVRSRYVSTFRSHRYFNDYNRTSRDGEGTSGNNEETFLKIQSVFHSAVLIFEKWLKQIGKIKILVWNSRLYVVYLLLLLFLIRKGTIKILFIIYFEFVSYFENRSLCVALFFLFIYNNTSYLTHHNYFNSIIMYIQVLPKTLVVQFNFSPISIKLKIHEGITKFYFKSFHLAKTVIYAI